MLRFEIKCIIFEIECTVAQETSIVEYGRLHFEFAFLNLNLFAFLRIRMFYYEIVCVLIKLVDLFLKLTALIFSYEIECLITILNVIKMK